MAIHGGKNPTQTDAKSGRATQFIKSRLFPQSQAAWRPTEGSSRRVAAASTC